METIIGLLFVLIPVIMKLIGKKLEDAGKQDTPAPPAESGTFEVAPATPEAPVASAPVASAPVVKTPVVKTPVVNAPVVNAPVEEAPRQFQAAKPKKKPILIEEEKKQKEKIDPKKLVIYSEIMSPKYKE